MDAVLTLNAGSSSIKAAVFDAGPPLRLLFRAAVEGLGDKPHFHRDHRCQRRFDWPTKPGTAHPCPR